MKSQYTTGLVAGLLSVATFGFYCTLPGRSMDDRQAETSEVEHGPEAQFRIGSVRWDVATYKADPKLQPLRDFLSTRCPNKAGLDAATCMSDVFAATFVHGMPRAEIFNATYDPVADLESHMAGERGHCVTRAGLISAALLATGTPARLVQYVHPTLGHNVMEVWDTSAGGWVFFDPTTGDSFWANERPLSALRALVHGEGERRQIGRPAYWMDLYTATRGPEIALRYPEPWLYTRTGSPQASWPFRARSITVGAPPWNQGPVQRVARPTFIALGLAALGFLIAGALASRRSQAATVSARTEHEPDGAISTERTSS